MIAFGIDEIDEMQTKTIVMVGIEIDDEMDETQYEHLNVF